MNSVVTYYRQNLTLNEPYLGLYNHMIFFDSNSGYKSLLSMSSKDTYKIGTKKFLLITILTVIKKRELIKNPRTKEIILVVPRGGQSTVHF